MSGAEITAELPRLTEVKRRAVLGQLRELAALDEAVRVCDATAEAQAAALERMEEEAVSYHPVDLRARGNGRAQAADLRARLKSFAEDWNRPEPRSMMQTRRGDCGEGAGFGGDRDA